MERGAGMGGVNLDTMMDSFERKIIEYACSRFGSTRKAAKAIGISQTQLVRKKKKYGITSGEAEEKDERSF